MRPRTATFDTFDLADMEFSDLFWGRVDSVEAQFIFESSKRLSISYTDSICQSPSKNVQFLQTLKLNGVSGLVHKQLQFRIAVTCSRGSVGLNFLVDCSVL
jgi:hypothetical protein